MADLAASAVEFLDSWEEGGITSKRFVARRVRLTLTGQGTTTNKIPASVLEMDTLVDSSACVKSDNSVIYSTCPSYDQANLLIGDGGSNAPQDVTGVFDLTVRGTRTV